MRGGGNAGKGPETAGAPGGLAIIGSSHDWLPHPLPPTQRRSVGFNNEVFLKSNYMELGISNAGSFGSMYVASAGPVVIHSHR